MSEKMDSGEEIKNMHEQEKNKNIEKKPKSKLTHILLGIIATLVVTVIGLVGYSIYIIIQSNTSTKQNNNDENIRPWGINEYKPIIYIYPTETTDVEVKLGKPQYLSCTYPKYERSWKVTANPNGDLIDKETGRKLYALYWEGEGIPKNTDMQEGYCIKGEDTAKFLEEKLATLGLNEREAEEFIVYWLPQMEDNKYNYIRFETIEEQNESMPLQVTPKPDNIIRVMMDWKKLDEPIKVQEQKLERPSREGYTVVEWGGSII